MNPILRVNFFIERDDMSDDEYNNQEFNTFLITEDMIRILVEQNVRLKENETICDTNFFITKI